MSEEKKVLTPEEIAENLVDCVEYDLMQKRWLIDRIREYGEQQYTLGSHGLFKEIAAKEDLE